MRGSEREAHGSGGGMPSVHSRLPSSLAASHSLPRFISLATLCRADAASRSHAARAPLEILRLSVPCLLPREILKVGLRGSTGVSAPLAGLLQSAVLKAALCSVNVSLNNLIAKLYFLSLFHSQALEPTNLSFRHVSFS